MNSCLLDELVAFYETVLINGEDNGLDKYQTLMEKAKKGFETLDLPDKFKVDALDQLKVWLTHEQDLVDEVTGHVSTIRRLDLDAAAEKGLLVTIGKEVDDAYHAAVAARRLSDARGVKILLGKRC